MSGYDDHNVECDGSECVTYECAFLNMPENPVVQRVIDLWDREGGWIPGAARARLAEALGVPEERVRTAQQLRQAAHAAHHHESWQIQEGAYGPYCAACGVNVSPDVPKPKGN